MVGEGMVGVGGDGMVDSIVRGWWVVCLEGCRVGLLDQMLQGVWVWCGVVWCGVVWCGVVWCGVVW